LLRRTGTESWDRREDRVVKTRREPKQTEAATAAERKETQYGSEEYLDRFKLGEKVTLGRDSTRGSRCRASSIDEREGDELIRELGEVTGGGKQRRRLQERG